MSKGRLGDLAGGLFQVTAGAWSLFTTAPSQTSQMRGAQLGPWGHRPVGTVAVLSLHSSAPGGVRGGSGWGMVWGAACPGSLQCRPLAPPCPAKAGRGPPTTPATAAGVLGPSLQRHTWGHGERLGPSKRPRNQLSACALSLSHERTNGFYFPGCDFYHRVCRTTNTYLVLRGEKQSP